MPPSTHGSRPNSRRACACRRYAAIANRSARQSNGSSHAAEWRASPTASTISGTARIPNPGIAGLGDADQQARQRGKREASGVEAGVNTSRTQLPRTQRPPRRSGDAANSVGGSAGAGASVCRGIARARDLLSILVGANDDCQAA